VNLDAAPHGRLRRAGGDRGWAIGLVSALVLWSWVGLVVAAPGDLDPTFGTGGLSITFGPADSVGATVVQPDGKLVVAGRSSTNPGPIAATATILLVRYLPDGRGDTSFGSGGKVTTLVGSGSSATALVLQPDGKFVVAGSATVGAAGPNTSSQTDLLLARFQPDGHLDATFGFGGVVTTTVESNSAAFALIQQPDGKLVVAGTSDPAQANAFAGRAFLVRYLSDGQVDPSFGTQGTVTIGSAGISRTNSTLLFQPDGKLVVALPSVPLRVVRVLPDGRFDLFFGTQGTVTIGSVGGPGSGGVAPPGGASLILQPDGKLVVANSILPPQGGVRPQLTRLLPDGGLDATFGTGGTATTGVSANVGGNPALVLQPDGKLVVAGYTISKVPSISAPLSDMLLSRFQPDGHLDVAFGVGGTATATVTGTSAASALIQQPDGQLVTAGTHSESPPATRFVPFDILLARYQALGCPVVNPEPCLAALAAFVTEVYQAALARQPDAGEEAAWVDALAREPNLDTARALLHTVFDGPEFRQRPVNPWQYVEALYLAMLGREPDKAESDWWVQQVLDRYNTLLPGFVDSQEFQRLVPSCRDAGAVSLLVGRLYLYALGRGGSPAELVWWTQAMLSDCGIEEGVEDFLNSLEYLAVPRTLAEHVTVLYRALLAREPGAGELAWWVNDLGGQLADLEDDVMASPEFAAHFFDLFP
jgi:uncharacterized delta-60 repeat protein